MLCAIHTDCSLQVSVTVLVLVRGRITPDDCVDDGPMQMCGHGSTSLLHAQWPTICLHCSRFSPSPPGPRTPLRHLSCLGAVFIRLQSLHRRIRVALGDALVFYFTRDCREICRCKCYEVRARRHKYNGHV